MASHDLQSWTNAVGMGVYKYVWNIMLCAGVYFCRLQRQFSSQRSHHACRAFSLAAPSWSVTSMYSAGSRTSAGWEDLHSHSHFISSTCQVVQHGLTKQTFFKSISL